MKAWNYIKNDCDQETAKEYSTIVQTTVKDDREKAIAWRLVSCKMTCYTYQTKISMNSQSAFCTPSAFYIERIGIAVFVCSLHFVLNGLVLLCLFEQASSLDRNIGVRKKKFSETILAAMIDEWTVCWRAPEEKSTMIEQWSLYTNWRRTQMRGLPIWLHASDALFRGHSVVLKWTRYELHRN